MRDRSVILRLLRTKANFDLVVFDFCRTHLCSIFAVFCIVWTKFITDKNLRSLVPFVGSWKKLSRHDVINSLSRTMHEIRVMCSTISRKDDDYSKNKGCLCCNVKHHTNSRKKETKTNEFLCTTMHEIMCGRFVGKFPRKLKSWMRCFSPELMLNARKGHQSACINSPWCKTKEKDGSWGLDTIFRSNQKNCADFAANFRKILFGARKNTPKVQGQGPVQNLWRWL